MRKQRPRRRKSPQVVRVDFLRIRYSLICRRGKQIPTDVNNQFTQQANKSDLLDDEEDFFDFISRYVKGISTIHVILQRVIHFSMSGSSRSEWTTKGALWQIQNPPLIPPTEVTIV